jgi:antitoxin VapB
MVAHKRYDYPKNSDYKVRKLTFPNRAIKIILEPIENSWEQWFVSLTQFSNDFMANGREQPEQAQERD